MKYFQIEDHVLMLCIINNEHHKQVSTGSHACMWPYMNRWCTWCLYLASYLLCLTSCLVLIASCLCHTNQFMSIRLLSYIYSLLLFANNLKPQSIFLKKMRWLTMLKILQCTVRSNARRVSARKSWGGNYVLYSHHYY